MDERSKSADKRCAYLGMSAETTFGYAQAVQIGDTIHVSGQLGLDSNGNLAAPAILDANGYAADFSNMEEQMRTTYKSAARVLGELGATLDDVVQETLFVLDIASAFAVGGKVRKEAYGTQSPRVASNLIGISRLALAEQLIEIAFVAIKRG